MAEFQPGTYGPGFLRALDLLKGGKIVSPKVTIQTFFEPNHFRSAATQELIDKPAVKFSGSDKILVLNKTNAAIIHFNSGFSPEEGENWIGRVIQLEVRLVRGKQGKISPGIRIHLEIGQMMPLSVIKQMGKAAIFDPERGGVYEDDGSGKK